jgi:hypothetical protein
MLRKEAMNLTVIFRRFRCAFSALVVAGMFLQVTIALADTYRLVTYNILADSGGQTTARPEFYTVMQGIGDEIVNGVAQPADIIALEETTSNAVTIAPIVTGLNNIYGAGTYAMSPYQATQNGSAGSGNGPNALVYKTTTLQLIASIGIGTPSTAGFPRQPVRYQFRPVAADASFDFYVYVSHAKAGTTTTDKNRRNIEAQAIRANELSLPATARVIYTGDWNLTASTEAAYQTLLAAGNGQAFDPPNVPGNWELNPAVVAVMTYSGSNLRYRDDFVLVTQNIMSDPSGFMWVAGSFHPFGNNGSVGVNGSLNSPGNTALPGLPNRAAVLAAITTASDHIPVVADFVIDFGGNGVAPEITAQPTNDTTCTGGLASFAVTASGSPAPAFQWRKGTTNLVDGGSISGATTDTLTINPAAGGDAATNYNCVATNASGSATSNNAALTINVAPSITTQPQRQTLTIGGTAAFSVVATGTPAPAYQWRKNNVPLQDGGNISGAASASLTISPAAAADAGNYDAVITNSCDAVTTARAPFWQLGDTNCDGSINFTDINPFVLMLTDPAGYATAFPACDVLNGDINSDGSASFGDINAFVATLTGG